MMILRKNVIRLCSWVLLCAASLAFTACADPAVTPMNSMGGPVDLNECARVQAETPRVLAKDAPTRLELQALIQTSAETCPGYEHGLVTGPICKTYPDACIGKLEKELQ